jgi:hypothetical protein
MQKFNLKYSLIVNLLLSSFSLFSTNYWYTNNYIPNRDGDFNNFVPDTISDLSKFGIFYLSGLTISFKYNSDEAPILSATGGLLTGIIFGILGRSANLELETRRSQLRIPQLVTVVAGTVAGSRLIDKLAGKLKELNSTVPISSAART